MNSNIIGNTTVDRKTENEITSEEDINLYKCWEILVKRKKFFFGVFLIPIVIATIITMSFPRHYRGEGAIYYPVIPIWPVAIATAEAPAPNFVKLVGRIDDAKKSIIFSKNPDAIKSVLISLPKKSNDKITILIDAKAADIIPQAYKDLFYYINNVPEIKEETTRIKKETKLKIDNLTEVRNANQIFLNQVTAMMKKEQIPHISVGLSDLIKTDIELSLEIKKLHDAEVKFATLSPLIITVEPSDSHLRMIIVSTGVFSLAAAVFVVFFLLDFIERIKTSEHEQGSLP